MGLVEQKKQIQKEMIPVLYDLIENWEDEIVEFKEASNNFKQDEIGQYFSAISNEANLHNLQYGWLVFGVKNKGHSIEGTDYRNTDGLKILKNEISHNTTGGISFIDIYEVYPVVKDEIKRVIMFQIPAAIAAVPTGWKNLEYGREGESLVPLSQEKRERIRRQTFLDWSKQFVKGATINHLNSEAIKVARIKYKEKMDDEIISDEVDKMSDEEFLQKRRLMVDDKITNAAMLLLGDEQYDYMMDRMPEASWRVHDSRGMVRDYKIFKIPFITLGDRVFDNIRNLTYRYMPDRTTLFPAEVKQYDSWILREVLNNCIVHSDYSLGGRIYIHEFDNKLVFTNPGSFIPNNIEALLRPGYTSPFYRNQLLADAMVMFDLIDTEAMGIRKMFYIQQERYFPLPSFDLSNEGIVEVSVFGEELNDNYMHILYDHPELNLEEIYYLDQVQKGQVITKEAANKLRKMGFVEGRIDSLRIKLQIAGFKEDNKERKPHVFSRKENERLRNLIYVFIVETGGAAKSDIYDMIVPQFPTDLSDDKKEKKVMNLLAELKKQGYIERSGDDKKNSYWIAAK